MPRFCAFLLLCCLPLTGGCALVKSAGMSVLYRKAPLAENRILRDLPYIAGSNSPQQRLDLFLPAGTGWPVMVFVHGGGWTEGDKGYRFAGQDVYGNIGRFYAARGIGVAVINYRLQPQAAWRDQVEDVARATAWVARHAPDYGGDPHRLFLFGHSAGGHLAAYAASDAPLRRRWGLPELAGVIGVSGAAYDLTDMQTYRLGHKIAYYAGVFNPDGKDPDWQKHGSPATRIGRNSPPFLLLVAEGDDASMRRQSSHFHDLLSSRGIPNEFIIVPGQSHTRIVLTLSRPDKTTAPAILRFVGNPTGNENRHAGFRVKE